MATIAAKAERRAKVNQRLVSLSDQVADTFGVEVPQTPRTTRDPELDQIIELERIADLLDGILNGEPESIGDETEAAEGDENLIWANPGFVDMSREDLEKFAVDWYQLDPAQYPDDMALQQALVAAYDKDTGGTGEGEIEQEEGGAGDLDSLKLDDLKQRAIDAGHDADEVNKKRSKKDVIAILNGETEQEEGEG